MRQLSYARHRFPPVIIQHAVWLYFQFALSYRDVKDMLAERGIDASYETVRRWALKSGRSYADRIRRRRPRPSDSSSISSRRRAPFGAGAAAEAPRSASSTAPLSGLRCCVVKPITQSNRLAKERIPIHRKEVMQPFAIGSPPRGDDDQVRFGIRRETWTGRLRVRMAAA
jgi:hypothetical protein